MSSWIRIRIQQLKLMGIHEDPDPQPWSIFVIYFRDCPGARWAVLQLQRAPPRQEGPAHRAAQDGHGRPLRRQGRAGRGCSTGTAHQHGKNTSQGAHRKFKLSTGRFSNFRCVALKICNLEPEFFTDLIRRIRNRLALRIRNIACCCTILVHIVVVFCSIVNPHWWFQCVSGSRGPNKSEFMRIWIRIRILVRPLSQKKVEGTKAFFERQELGFFFANFGQFPCS